MNFYFKNVIIIKINVLFVNVNPVEQTTFFILKEKNMFKMNDVILYGVHGVCKIIEIIERPFKNEMLEYYVLECIHHQNQKIYIPVHNQELTEKMKKILSVEEIQELINHIHDIEVKWINNDNQRREEYKKILRNGQRQEIMSLIHTLYLKQKELNDKGKKLHVADYHLFEEAEKMIYEEFSCVLDIQQSEVTEYIISHIKE